MAVSISGFAWRQYLPEVERASQRLTVPVPLILGVIAQESSFRAIAYRYEPKIQDASIGLMQLLVGTARGMRPGVTETELYNPQINIDLGTQYLGQQLRRYGGEVAAAVSAYNAGHALRLSAGGFVNQYHVDRVLAFTAAFRQALASDPPGEPVWPPVTPADPGPLPAGGTVWPWVLLGGLGVSVYLLLRR